MTLSSTFNSAFAGIGIGRTVKKLREQARDVLVADWYLGVTAFGGPPVHFQIVCDQISSISAV